MPSSPAVPADPPDHPSAASLASSDALESASTVEPAQASPSAHEAEAAEARVSAEKETAAQARAAQVAVGIGAPKPGAPPPGFGAPPDFDTPRPPPAAAVSQTQPAYLRQSDSAWTVLGRTIAARARQLFDRAGQRITQRTLRIGVSARIFHPEPGARGLPLRRRLIYGMRARISAWSPLVFRISRDIGRPGLFVKWGKVVLALYHGLAYSRGRTGAAIDRLERLARRFRRRSAGSSALPGEA